MRISRIAAYLAVVASVAHAASLGDAHALNLHEERATSDVQSGILVPENPLEKRKGGGGKGGGGGGECHLVTLTEKMEC